MGGAFVAGGHWRRAVGPGAANFRARPASLPPDITFVSGPETGKRKRVTRKDDGKLTLLVNLGGSWHEKLTLLFTHFSLSISGSLNFAGPDFGQGSVCEGRECHQRKAPENSAPCICWPWLWSRSCFRGVRIPAPRKRPQKALPPEDWPQLFGNCLRDSKGGTKGASFCKGMQSSEIHWPGNGD